ncbi:MAG: hypothetical protein IIA81_02205 [Thaumarchaeota archaeon]|nr:hypothetical protein [Nitrososphaerota archaeon]
MQKTIIIQSKYQKKYLNNRDSCYVCKQPPEDEYIFIKHHVSYFPEIIAFVHFECHQKIHDPEKPIKELIKFNDRDSRKFYEMQNQLEKDSKKINFVEDNF